MGRAPSAKSAIPIIRKLVTFSEINPLSASVLADGGGGSSSMGVCELASNEFNSGATSLLPWPPARSELSLPGWSISRTIPPIWIRASMQIETTVRPPRSSIFLSSTSTMPLLGARWLHVWQCSYRAGFLFNRAASPRVVSLLIRVDELRQYQAGW